MPLLRFLLLLLTFVLLNVYIFIRGWQALPSRSVIHAIYSVLFIIASLSIFIAIFAGNRLPLWLSHTFELIGGYWMILFIFILFAAFLGDILRLANHFFGIFPQWITANYNLAKQGYLGFVLLVLILISVIGYIRFSKPFITKINIPYENQDLNSSEIHLLAISDIHLGNLIRKGRLQKWVDIINRQNADIILIAGDLFDHNMQTVEFQKMDEELSRLNAHYGVYAIPGNHDYYAGIDRAIQYMKKSGIKVLRDQAVTIDQKFSIIGRDDVSNKNRKTLDSLILGLRPGIPRILLDHQPHNLAESREKNIDLHISGHTHNGQIFPFNRIVSGIYELGYGYKKAGKTHYYVSSGLGLWGAPIRIGTRSEIVSIVIKVN